MDDPAEAGPFAAAAATWLVLADGPDLATTIPRMSDEAGSVDAPPPNLAEPSPWARLRAAPVTTGVGVGAAAATLLWWSALRSSSLSQEEFRDLFWQPGHEIWSGAWWTLVTSAFIHVDLMHLAFNLYWMYRLVVECERRTGPLRWGAFFVATTALSSFAELVVSDDTGIGLSGFAYAAFGFAWRRSATDPRWNGVIRPTDPSLWVGWGVLCWVLTLAGVWNVGNAAHAAGLVVGLGWAFVTEPGRWAGLRIAAVSLAFGSAILGAVRGVPWSASWEITCARDALEVPDAKAALPHLLRARELGADPTWCLMNIGWAYYCLEDEMQYDATLHELRALDAAAYGEMCRSYREPADAK